MRLLMLVALGVSVVGCDRAPARAAQERQSELASRIRYIRDYRTSLCFAVYNPGQNNGMMAEVPCYAVVGHIQ